MGGGGALFATHPLTRQRSLTQLLGRVGRYQQGCRCYKPAELVLLVNQKSFPPYRHIISNRAEHSIQYSSTEESEYPTKRVKD